MPILVYVAGLPAKEAIAASLFVVGVTSLAGVVSHARGGRVQWRTGLLFGPAAMVGALTGGLLGARVPGDWLLIAFALMMVATSLAMLRGHQGTGAGRHGHPDRPLPLNRILVDGSVVGLVTGLVGAGGGFLVAPALLLLGGLPISTAVGTSLVVIAMKCSRAWPATSRPSCWTGRWCSASPARPWSAAWSAAGSPVVSPGTCCAGSSPGSCW